MGGWLDWEGKKVFVSLKSNKVFQGVIIEVADLGNGLVFFTLTDKFDHKIVFNLNEIVVLKEEF